MIKTRMRGVKKMYRRKEEKGRNETQRKKGQK